MHFFAGKEPEHGKTVLWNDDDEPSSGALQGVFSIIAIVSVIANGTPTEIATAVQPDKDGFGHTSLRLEFAGGVDTVNVDQPLRML